MSVSKKKHSLGKYRKSILIDSLTKLAGRIYRTFLAGFFGWILTSYEALVSGFSSSVIIKKLQTVSGLKIFHFASNAKRRVAEAYERSFFLNLLRSISEKLLTARIASFGLFFFSYGFYLILIQVIREYALPADNMAMSGIIIGVAYMLFGTLFLFSKRNIAYTIYHSKFLGGILFEFLGLRITDVAEAAENENKKGWNAPFISGMVFGLISIFLDPLMILAIILLFALFYVIVISPEAGIILVCMGLPFLETLQLAALICLIDVSYILKLICGRRMFRLQMMDFTVLAFLLFVIFGGIFTIDGSSFWKMLVFVCFMSVYFVIKNIISSPALVKRCLYALVLASALVSAYGIYQNYFGDLSSKWHDISVFSEIRGRVVSTFDNPNVLGEFLVLIFPITLALMASAKKANERFFLFVSALLSCGCLVFTWSRGAWLACIITTALFLCVSSKYFFTAGILSMPILGMFVFLQSDSAIIRRITSFGDSSTSYRVNIWKGVLQMLEDIGFFGIGIGEEAFRKVYPIYALAGIEAAPHSHNLYLQITVEMGVFALLFFLIFVFMFTQFSFSFSKNAMNRSNRLLCMGIFCGAAALLIQGLTDYVWYNYRIFLLFWIVVGLGVAHVSVAKDTEEESDRIYF
ncbi:MAG: hypothetical protein E7603_01015 [Ruminococcaceae bacterium]|nr:hypothetical protein [Oscillospiraceae bacterium]